VGFPRANACDRGEARREGLPGPGVETGMFAITV